MDLLSFLLGLAVGAVVVFACVAVLVLYVAFVALGGGR